VREERSKNFRSHNIISLLHFTANAWYSVLRFFAYLSSIIIIITTTTTNLKNPTFSFDLPYYKISNITTIQ